MISADTFHVSQVKESRLLMLLDVWNAARADRNALPLKSSIDISALGKAKLLPHAWLVEVPDDSEPFYRVAGDQIRSLFATKMQQRALSEIYAQDLAVMLEERWRGMLTARTISHTAGLVYFDTHKSLAGERLAFPVADETNTPRYILGATIYEHSSLKPSDERPLDFDQKVHTEFPIQSIPLPKA